MTHDAIVIGAGPNGLTAANTLADAGWSVLVLEANREVGGAVRTADLTAPGFRNDMFSAFFPFAAASPVLARLGLREHGLVWAHAPAVVAHPRRDRPAAVLHRDPDATAAMADTDEPGDGQRYLDLYREWMEVSEPLVGALLAPFPPVRHGLRLARAAGLDGLREVARTSLLPLQRLLVERFRGEAAGLLFAGNALHADLTPEMAGSALFGWLLTGLGQQHGFPVPVGGAGEITNALARRAVQRGADVRCGTAVARIRVEGGCATGVVTDDGDLLTARVVIADCDAARLLLEMVGVEHLSSRHVARLGRFQRGSATFKVDWALTSPVPWADPAVASAGAVHIASGMDELVAASTQIQRGVVPRHPFLVVGQMTTADPTRSPAGTESMWAYTHVPQDVRGDAGDDDLTGRWTPAEAERFAARIEARIEEHAPGFTERIVGRHVMAPPDLERHNRNLVGGDISGGTNQIHQMAVFRPLPGWSRAETPIENLYLGSASAHPGGGVHGACGHNAARAALAHHPVLRARRRLSNLGGGARNGEGARTS